MDVVVVVVVVGADRVSMIMVGESYCTVDKTTTEQQLLPLLKAATIQFAFTFVTKFCTNRIQT
jgi:hypothetical protein